MVASISNPAVKLSSATWAMPSPAVATMLVSATSAIAERCSVKLDFDTYHLPVFETGSDETSEFKAQSQAFADALDRAGTSVTAVEAPGRNHFDVILDLELSALESEGEGEVISTPRVITANQAEAYIQQGVEIPYEEATSSGATSVMFKEAVLELKVTPLITPDNRIQMDLNVKQDTVGEIFQTSRGGSVPSIDTRELETTVLVGNGDTVVLGGIFQDENLVVGHVAWLELRIGP